MINKYISKIILGMLVITSSHIATAEDNYNYNYAALNNRCAVYDPYEPINRKIFFVNGVLDTFILRPVAKGYGRFTNDYTKARVGSFSKNYAEPVSTVNYVLQGNSEGAFKTFWRFTINSTLGVFGIFDVASKFGLKAKPQTFANTLGYYGVGSGAYLVLPVYGSTTARGMLDPLVLNSKMNPLYYFTHSDFGYVKSGIGIVHGRNVVIPFTDHISKHSPDPYVAVREAYINSTESKMTYSKGFVCPVVKK